MRLNLRDIIEVPGGSVPFSCEMETEGLDFPSIREYLTKPYAEGRVYNEAGILRLEGLLTAKEWELNQVTRDGVDITETAGNKMRLYADHSFSFDYSPNDGYAFDFIWDAYATPYSWGTNKWSVAFGTVPSLVFAQYSFPLVIVGDCDNSDLPYEIVSLTDSALVLEYNNTTCGEESVHGLYRITFVPAS